MEDAIKNFTPTIMPDASVTNIDCDPNLDPLFHQVHAVAAAAPGVEHRVRHVRHRQLVVGEPSGGGSGAGAGAAEVVEELHREPVGGGERRGRWRGGRGRRRRHCGGGGGGGHVASVGATVGDLEGEGIVLQALDLFFGRAAVQFLPQLWIEV
ncbi:hypothetical protein STAS_28201 [Striga asiatica]|uniref:Uncharacterized protein n=1 Tax=Striga asiatica TaxID=4170 RepID=A0A5A7R3B5_STRAF|nr:hypothetical protein STAS_28201 [Striga asiatica]